MKTTRPRHAVVALCAVFALLGASPAAAEKVARVIDGDTIELTSGERIRYIGIDTPESAQPSKPARFMEHEAREYNRRLVEGKEVRLEYDVERKDKYGRTLAYVFVGTVFVNAELLRAGYALVLRVPPNVQRADFLRACQQEARDAGRGLWDEAAARAWASTRQAADAAQYYITKTGSKYHGNGCRHLSKSSFSITKEDAVARGYTPCSVCIGAAIESDPSSATPQATSAAGRCSATTKKGTQCKRNAKTGSNYCWQHGG